MEEIAINQVITTQLMNMQVDEYVKDMICSDIRTYHGGPDMAEDQNIALSKKNIGVDQ